MAACNEAQIVKVADLLKSLPKGEGAGLNFYSFRKGGEEIVQSDMFPPLDHPQVINFFFFGTMHDFGFWHGDHAGYVEPLFGTMGGQSMKGSDLLWRALKKAFDTDEARFDPEQLREITPDEFHYGLLTDDHGPIPFPDLEKRFKLTKAYTQWFWDQDTSPAELITAANTKEAPVKWFVRQLRRIPGYSGDPLRKKATLLAMALANRPEHFLQVTDPQNWRPIVDYHVMRLALRLGLVDLTEEKVEKNEMRQWVGQHEEYQIRLAAFHANRRIVDLSGKPMSFVDEKFWMARKYCPEMELPDCAKCIFDPVCKKRIELFQPVLRTTNY